METSQLLGSINAMISAATFNALGWKVAGQWIFVAAVFILAACYLGVELRWSYRMHRNNKLWRTTPARIRARGNGQWIAFLTIALMFVALSAPFAFAKGSSGHGHRGGHHHGTHR